MNIRIITSHTNWWLPPFKELYYKRELFLTFVKRQFFVRYQQSLLGILWSILNPLGTLFIFWLLFGVILKVPSNGYPYVIFAFAGLIPWNTFANTSNSVACSLQAEMGIVSKIYFPRIILPLVALTREALDCAIVTALLLIFCFAYGYTPTWRLLFLPCVMGAALLSGLSIGLLFAGPIVRFRDLRVPLNYALQLAMYITPVIYPPTIIPQQYIWVMELNPMYWVMQASRWVLLGSPIVFTPFLYICLSTVMISLIIGWLIFAYTERSIVDLQ